MKMNHIIFFKKNCAQKNRKFILFINILFVFISITLFQIWLITSFDEYKFWLHTSFDKNDLAGFMNNDGKNKYMVYECM